MSFLGPAERGVEPKDEDCLVAMMHQRKDIVSGELMFHNPSRCAFDPGGMVLLPREQLGVQSILHARSTRDAIGIFRAFLSEHWIV